MPKYTFHPKKSTSAVSVAGMLGHKESIAVSQGCYQHHVYDKIAHRDHMISTSHVGFSHIMLPQVLGGVVSTNPTVDGAGGYALLR